MEQGVADYLRSPGGHIVGGWLLGFAPKVTFYGPETELVKGIRENGEFLDGYMDDVREFLGNGTLSQNGYSRNGTLDPNGYSDRYEFGGLILPNGTINPHVEEDANTIRYPGSASLGNHMKVAIGSYGLTARVISIDDVNRTATIAFSGINHSTLGSALPLNADVRAWLNSVAPENGPTSDVAQVFGWSQKVSY